MNFFWIKNTVFRNYIRAKCKNDVITEFDLGNGSYKKLHQINRCFSNNPWGLQHDISNHVPHPFRIKTQNPYTFANEYQSFGDICLATADRISHMTDRPIAVSWSGGIDSTVALVALMQTVDHGRLIVVCNNYSVDEFPSFYEQKIKNKLQIITPTYYVNNYQNFFAVSGDGGDTVWGVIDNDFWNSNHKKFNLPWQDCINKEIINDIDFIEEFCSWSGRKITTWLDLRTWYYLCCKWQDKCMRQYYLIQGLTDKDAVQFYNIDSSFQRWTMNNLDQIIGIQWQDYKIPAKNFIHQYHDDVTYQKYKTKVESVYLAPDLITASSKHGNLRSTTTPRIVLSEDFCDYQFPSWPFISFKEIEDFNDKYQLFDQSLFFNH
jgi:hypothetical protein